MEPVAIIGIGCRFPGGIQCPRSCWKALSEGKDAITEVPADRWDAASFHHPDRDRAGTVYSRRGGFLQDIRLFDPQFFGISPREADFIDPQQRLLLETTWEALEDGGQAPEQWAGSKVGVFVGLFMHDYENLHCAGTERSLYGPHSATGMSATIAANRLSYVFDFRGPSVVVDTACSSSLVAVHLACRSLCEDESEMAVAGGVNVLLRPDMSMILCRGSFLSPDGYCKAFDARADGYTRSEGAGMLVLKRLSRALGDRDPIYAVIRGSAVNQDGRSDGLTVPRAESQVAVLQDALRTAGVAPEDIHYIEAHGTGTAVGDPIETRALGTVLSHNRPPEDPCVIGSVKTNFGHTESAAGVAGLIKATMVLQHRHIPPNLHFETPNPQIPFDELRLRVPTSLEPWDSEGDRPRIAGVNSFGFGGTNAHVVLQEADETMVPAAPRPASNRGEGKPIPVPLSAHSPEALRAVAADYVKLAENLGNRPGDELSEASGRDTRSAGEFGLSDLGYATSHRRGHHPHRLSVVAGTGDELARLLEAYLAGEQRREVTVGHVGPQAPSRLAFVFSGMGQQWRGMGQELWEREAVCRDRIEACHALFAQHTSEWRLWDELKAEQEDSRIHETRIAQPCIFALQVALAALWRSWGVDPEAVVGHSVGEIAAAHVAGVLTLEDAVRVCFHRSRLQQTTAGQGSMLAIGLSMEETETLLEAFGTDVSIGAVNSDTAVTVSGNTAVLQEVAGLLESEQVFARFLKVEVPYHSPMMDSILSELEESLAGIAPQPARLALFSTVTGTAAEGPEIDAAYWRRNVRQPVLFADAFGAIVRTGTDWFLEVSAHPVLGHSMQECLSQRQATGTVVHSLRRMEPQYTTMLGAFSRATGLVELESLLEAIKVVFPRFADVNIKAAKLGYERVDVKEYTK